MAMMPNLLLFLALICAAFVQGENGLAQTRSSDNVLAIGLGYDGSQLMDDLFLLNPESGTTCKLSGTGSTIVGAEAAYQDGKIWICGGFWPIAAPTLVFRDTCSYHKPTSSSIPPTEKMRIGRAFAGSALFPKGDWLMTGGTYLDNKDLLGEAEVKSPSHGGKWNPFLPLPQSVSHHCVAISDTNFAVAIGGIHDNGEKTAAGFKINLVSDTKWTAMPDMPEARRDIACAWIDNNSLIVVGDSPATDTTLLYNLSTKRWSNGPRLPEERGGSRLVRHGDRLLLIGGFSAIGPYPTTILELTENASWEPLPVELETGRSAFVAVSVPKEEFPCN